MKGRNIWRKSLWIAMLASVGALGMLASGAAAATCTLTAADFAALAQSPSHIKSQAQVDALDEPARSTLCQTRAIADRIMSKTFTDEDVSHFPAKAGPYVTAAERQACFGLSAAYSLLALGTLSQEKWNSVKAQWVKRSKPPNANDLLNIH